MAVRYNSKNREKIVEKGAYYLGILTGLSRRRMKPAESETVAALAVKEFVSVYMTRTYEQFLSNLFQGFPHQAIAVSEGCG
jgi:hypothetical protein